MSNLPLLGLILLLVKEEIGLAWWSLNLCFVMNPFILSLTQAFWCLKSQLENQ
jgi:hypothetical protein